MKRILLLEDDPGLANGLSYSLEKNGFCVDTAGSISCAKEYISKNKNTYSLLILDVMLPDGSGFEICEYMRRCGDSVPIIFLTASDEEINVIRGLDSRFPLKLYNLRRHHDRPRKDCVSVDGSFTAMTSSEYRLLCFLACSSGQILTRERLLEYMWDSAENFVDDNTLSVYIRRLRAKIEKDPSHPARLITVRGFGYQLREVE